MIKFAEIVAVCCDINTKKTVAMDKYGVRFNINWGYLQVFLRDNWNRA